MQLGQWVKVLREAREKPEFYIGSKSSGHLVSMVQLSWLAWETPAFADPHSAALICSPTQCLTRFESGPLISPIEGLVDWENCDILFDALLDVARPLCDGAVDGSATWLQSFKSATFGFGGFGMPLYLADRGLLGIRTAAGLWCQAYERGWPTTPPVLLQSGSPVSLVVAVSLSPEWFTGLPFVLAQVEGALPEPAKPHVHLEYRSANDLVPERVLRPEDIQRWL